MEVRRASKRRAEAPGQYCGTLSVSSAATPASLAHVDMTRFMIWQSLQEDISFHRSTRTRCRTHIDRAELCSAAFASATCTLSEAFAPAASVFCVRAYK